MLSNLNISATGLAAASTQVDNVMNNIANENTPGYKKRVVNITESEHINTGLTGSGVTIGDTTRITNIYMYDNLTSETSKQSQNDQLSSMLADIESIVSETYDSGLSVDLNRYFQSLDNLRSSPSNVIYQNDVQLNGQIIVDDLKGIYSDIDKLQTVSKNTVYDNIDSLNSLLNNIGDVNYQLSLTNKVSNDLFDKRDQLEQSIAKLTDIEVDRTSTSYELKLSDLTAVRFETNIHQVNVVESTRAQRDIYATDNRVNNLVKDTWEDAGDSVTYYLNNDLSISVDYNETVSAPIGTDPETYEDITVDKTNIVRALAAKINADSQLKQYITAYNGEYTVAQDGTKILPNNPEYYDYDSNEPNKDRYLVLESTVPGEIGRFNGQLVVNDANAAKLYTEVANNSMLSLTGTNDVHLEIFDKEATLQSGSLKPMLDNLTTDSGANRFSIYKQQLDDFAKALSDLSSAYIANNDGSYVSGIAAVNVDDNNSNAVSLNLFSGSSVNTLQFNGGVVKTLTQNDLDYLSSLQWKDDIDFDGAGDKASFSSYYQSFRVKVSNDKENIDFKKDAQDAVTQSLQTTYDKLTKVDKDEEMMNLIKFQAAYTANAKLVTVFDQMIQTLLGIKQ